MLRCSVAVIIFIFLAGFGCSSKNLKSDLFEYHYSGSPIPFDDQNHIVIFERNGEAFRPMLAVVDKKILPASALRFAESVHLKVHPLVKRPNGYLELSISKAVFDIEFKGGILASDQKGFLDGFYSSKAILVKDSHDYSDGRLQVDPITDSGDAIAVQTHGIEKWISDMNQNGQDETWIAIGSSLQIWEGYKKENSLLLLNYSRF